MLRGFAAVLAALVILTTGAAGPVPEAHADASTCATNGERPCVLVAWSGATIASGEQGFDTAEIAGLSTQTLTNYPFCGGPCPPLRLQDQNNVPASVPVRSLILALDDVGFGPDQVTGATITDSNGGSATLSGATHDFADSDDPDFPFIGFSGGPALYPVVYSVGYQATAAFAYARSQRDPNEQNASQWLQTAPHGVLRLDLVVVGTVLHPRIKATPSSIKAGGTVTFTATMPTGEPTPASYSWDFGDGTHSTTGPTAAHLFAKAGSFPTYLTVKAPGAAGVSNAVTIDVGKAATPSTAHHSSPGRGTGSTANPVVGPTQGIGLHAGELPVTPSTGPYGPSSGASTTGAPAAGGTRRPSASPTGSRAALAPGFVRVDGILLDPAAAPRAAAARVSGQPETAPAARRGTTGVGTTLTGGAFGGGVLVLMILGALIEARRPARARARRVAP